VIEAYIITVPILIAVMMLAIIFVRRRP